MVSGEQDILLEELRQIKAGILKMNSAFPRQSISNGSAHVVNIFRPLNDAGRALSGINTTSSVVTSQPLAPGAYLFMCDNTIWIEVSPTPVAQVNSSLRLMGFVLYPPILIRAGDHVAAIADAGGPFTLFMKPIM